jgi:hypothetical protein
MIDYNTKNIKHNKSADTWWAEMMSMLCEDMMQEKLGIDDKNSPKGRLTSFNMYYPLVGLEYRTDNDSYKSLSYSTAYAFGCWLVRNYGGTSLIQKMSQSAYVDDDAILDALQACGYSIATMEDLLKLYTESLIFTDTTLGMRRSIKLLMYRFSILQQAQQSTRILSTRLTYGILHSSGW